ncbi:MAG: 16S rRNA (guanine(966)-N(2))-methyltransferase RsmD [Pseudomonadales bacterium]|nr:16S rRNA (guanine(966)-N(2))-methyltransferase RsmD [Pseudomonadales bacterium]MCP5183434.1 16S rRNA (guanine(966)-N(2))-methyltransferase RsmD [Pseudomonadales bacterium]
MSSLPGATIAPRGRETPAWHAGAAIPQRIGVQLKNEVRIISGKWKGRKLHFPPATTIRPTLGRARVTLFNWLAGYIENRRCLDLFAGSGALGFEAHSRGALHTTLVDADGRVVAALKDNAARLQATNLSILRQDALRFLKDSEQMWDLVFLDPPYDSDLLVRVFQRLSEHLTPDAIVYCESGQPLEPPAGYLLVKRSQVGNICMSLLSSNQ